MCLHLQISTSRNRANTQTHLREPMTLFRPVVSTEGNIRAQAGFDEEEDVFNDTLWQSDDPHLQTSMSFEPGDPSRVLFICTNCQFFFFCLALLKRSMKVYRPEPRPRNTIFIAPIIGTTFDRLARHQGFLFLDASAKTLTNMQPEKGKVNMSILKTPLKLFREERVPVTAPQSVYL